MRHAGAPLIQVRGDTFSPRGHNTPPHPPSLPQVYQLNTGHYLCRNKYYGRGLSIDGFRQALYQYLHNGKALRQDLFEPVLNKLRSLKAVLERQASYRFYSSSLLIIYEGQVRGGGGSQSLVFPLPVYKFLYLDFT